MTEQIERFVSEAGLLGPIAFIAAYALLTILLVPGTAPSVAAGVLFGPLWGTVLTVIGATLGASAAFAIARRGGRERVRRRFGPRTERVDAWLEGRGLGAVLAARLIPVVPFNAFNYGAGLTSIHPRDYVLGTAVGIIPGTFAFVALGDALLAPGSPQFLAAVGAIVVLTGVGVLVQRRRAVPDAAS